MFDRFRKDRSGMEMADTFARNVHPQLLTYFRRRLRADDRAEDLAQECILRFLRGGYDPAGSDARPIVFGIARHILSDDIARMRRENGVMQPSTDDHLAIPCNDPPPDRVVAAQAEWANLSGVIEAMPERTRGIFLMSRMQGLKHAEIAQHLGISKSAVEKHIMEATARLLRASKRSLW